MFQVGLALCLGLRETLTALIFFCLCISNIRCFIKRQDIVSNKMSKEFIHALQGLDLHFRLSFAQPTGWCVG